MLNKIKYILIGRNITAPEVNTLDGRFSLIDHSDGNGAQIENWDINTLGPLPTNTELAALDADPLYLSFQIQTKCDSLIDFWKEQGSSLIYKEQGGKYPSYKVMDAGLVLANPALSEDNGGTLMPVAEAGEILADVSQVRAAYSSAKAALVIAKASGDLTLISDLVTVWPTLAPLPSSV